jgi:ABC-2 type transport system permease protein
VNAFLTSLRKEMLEAWRTRRLLVLVVVLAAFGMLSPLMAKLMPQIFAFIPGGEQFIGLIPEPSLQDAIDQYNKNIGQFGVLLALLLSMGAVAQEKERGTAALMLVKPLPRWAFILAKFKALALCFVFALAISGMLGYIYTVLLFGALDIGAWIAMNLLLLAECLVYAAITLLFSTLLRSQAAAIGASFATLLAISAISAFPQIGKYLPGALAAWAQTLFRPAPAAAWSALWVSLGIIVVCLAAACWLFDRQEL